MRVQPEQWQAYYSGGRHRFFWTRDRYFSEDEAREVVGKEVVDHPVHGRMTTGARRKVRGRPGLDVLLRLQPVADDERAVVTAVMFVRDDGQPLTARDLRVPIGEAISQGTEFWAKWLGGRSKPVRLTRPRRPGPKGHPDEHWARVWELWRQAQRTAPRSPIQWMRQQWKGDPVGDATMRRWRDRAVRWEQEQQRLRRRSRKAEGPPLGSQPPPFSRDVTDEPKPRRKTRAAASPSTKTNQKGRKP